MENIDIKEIPDAPFFPAVNFKSETGICEIKGESYMEETFKFYSPLIDWLKRYIEEGNTSITFNFKLTYFNTSSSRQILDIIETLKKYQQDGGDVKIMWHYDPDDPDMCDEVEDFKIETGMDIELIPLYSED